MTRRTIFTASAVVFCLALVATWQLRGASRPDAASSEPGDDTGDAPRRARSETADAPPVRPVDPRLPPPVDALRAELRAPLVLRGHVTGATGTTPEREGATCRLGVDRTDDPSRCRLVLECGTTRLHGAPILHDTTCELSPTNALVRLVDEARSRGDRDPALAYDPAERTLVVTDDPDGFYGEYSITIAFDDPAPSDGDAP